MSHPEPCFLCGARGDVRIALVRWHKPAPDIAPYASLPRCRDAAACRERVEATGGRWMVESPGKGRAA